MNESIRVFIVDDHPLLREGIASVIQSEPDLVVVAEASNGTEAVERYGIHRPDVTLMDLQMPNMDGLAAMMAIRRNWPEARVVVLTTMGGDAQAIRALRAGASGYMLKSQVRKELVDAIRLVFAGRRYMSPDVAIAIAQHVAEDELSARELNVLKRVAAGNSNKRVALELEVSEETVKSHMKNIMVKLGANDRTHAVTIALTRGIIDLGPSL